MVLRRCPDAYRAKPIARSRRRNWPRAVEARTLLSFALMPTTPPNSLWIAPRSASRFPSLARDIQVDVVIVGAGITGITAAMLLQRAGKRVAIVEGRRVLEGETGHTTAHLATALDSRYATLRRDFGERSARLAYESSRAAIDQIAAFVKECSTR